MTLLIMSRPDLIARQTLIIPLSRPRPDAAEVSACVFAVAVEVVLVYGVEVLRWEGREV